MKIIFRGIAFSLFELSLAVSVSAAPAETVLHAFAVIDGRHPVSGLIADGMGNLYGTASEGGVSGSGTVFELSPPPVVGGVWTETVLYTFTGGTDGGSPIAGLIADGKGNLFGTASNGGASGSGVVFELSPPAAAGGTWTETVQSFSGGADGGQPFASLIADSKGNIYGTAFVGGASGWGVLFELSPPAAIGGAWTETVLHTFTGGTDGALPYASVIADSKGNLYGTTAGGGTAIGDLGNGVVFELSPPAAAGDAWTETVLHAFMGGTDGSYPRAGLIADSKGNLYGTAFNDGASGKGTVFELSPPAAGRGAWTETVLHAFTGGTDGSYPRAALIADSKGNLYGTASLNIPLLNGAVFELSPPANAGGAWTDTLLYTFTGGADVSDPESGLIADSKGNLYGTTYSGGFLSENGVVFELTGTGFVPYLPFAAFNSDVAVQYGKKPNTDAFELLSEFTLGSTSTGINPLTDPLTLTIGTFSTTLPAGSFKGPVFGAYYYTGVISGAELELGIAQVGAKQFAFAAAGQKASLAGTTSPVAVTLTIGSNTGTDLINPPKGGW